MSARYPHYVHYFELVPKVFEANAENEREAMDDFWDEHRPQDVQLRFITTDPERNQ